MSKILIPSEAKSLAEGMNESNLRERVIKEWNTATDLTPDKITGDEEIDGWQLKDAAKLMRRRWKMIEEMAEVLDASERGGTD